MEISENFTTRPFDSQERTPGTQCIIGGAVGRQAGLKYLTDDLALFQLSQYKKRPVNRM